VSRLSDARAGAPAATAVLPTRRYAVAVPELDDLLAAAAQEFEPEIRRRLGGLLGGFLRAYLPQDWEFRTDRGVATLRVGADGATSVRPGPSERPDVTVEIAYDRLARAIRTRGRSGADAPPPAVTTHTAKGRAAFDYLRGRLGL